MSDFINARQEVTKSPERDIYEELPAPVVEFSKRLETTVTDLIEDHPSVPVEKGDKPFTNNEVQTRSGGYVALLPQHPKYHEHGALTHLDWAAWVAQNYEDVSETLLSPEAYAIVSSLPKGVDTLPVVVAAQLHDIEKAFWLSSVSEKPWVKHPNRAKVMLLPALLEEIPEERDYKRPLQKYFLMGEPTVFDSTKLHSLKGFFQEEGVNVAEVLDILSVYYWVDEHVIHMNINKINDPTAFNEEFNDFVASSGLSKESLVFGVLSMVCDNVSQGEPPQATEQFWQQQERSINFCSSLLEQL